MIVHELKCVYIHIPKTAGVSITFSLLSNVLRYEPTGAIKDLPVKIKNQFYLKADQKHKRAKDFSNEITKQQWKQYYKFTIVRNPWDKVVSEYHWRMSLKPKDHKFNGFNEFLEHCRRRIQGEEKGIYWTHAQPQLDFITDKKGNIIIDDVLKFENLSETVTTIEHQLEISLSLKKHNQSKHEAYRQYYNDTTAQFVYDLYEKDIKEFGYEF